MNDKDYIEIAKLEEYQRTCLGQCFSLPYHHHVNEGREEILDFAKQNAVKLPEVSDKWVSVKERLPKEFGYYAVYVQERREYWEREKESNNRRVEVKKVDYYNHIEMSNFDPTENKWDHDDVTHWQEITPPQEGE